MKKDDIYVSFDRIIYKQSRSSLLNMQIDLLNSEKHLEKIKQIRQRKSKLKSNLFLLFTKVINHLDKLEKSMPDDKIPKSIKNKMNEPQIETSLHQEPQIEKSPEENELDQELIRIQEKLKQLNNQI